MVKLRCPVNWNKDPLLLHLPPTPPFSALLCPTHPSSRHHPLPTPSPPLLPLPPLVGLPSRVAVTAMPPAANATVPVDSIADTCTTATAAGAGAAPEAEREEGAAVLVGVVAPWPPLPAAGAA